MDEPSGERPRRPRRSSEEIRKTILGLARELFDQHGYNTTSTRQIAKEAGVSERLIFSHFDSKAGLFNAAVVEPFVEVITGYMDSWIIDTHDWTAERRIDYFVSRLYDLAREHRTALLTALAANTANENSAHEHLLNTLARSFQNMQSITTTDEFHDIDLPAILITSVGMVLGTALLDDMIVPHNTRRPGRQRLIDEMRKTLLDGMRNRPDDTG